MLKPLKNLIDFFYPPLVELALYDILAIYLANHEVITSGSSKDLQNFHRYKYPLFAKFIKCNLHIYKVSQDISWLYNYLKGKLK